MIRVQGGCSDYGPGFMSRWERTVEARDAHVRDGRKAPVEQLLRPAIQPHNIPYFARRPSTGKLVQTQAV